MQDASRDIKYLQFRAHNFFNPEFNRIRRRTRATNCREENMRRSIASVLVALLAMRLASVYGSLFHFQVKQESAQTSALTSVSTLSSTSHSTQSYNYKVFSPADSTSSGLGALYCRLKRYRQIIFFELYVETKMCARKRQ
jgi:hypothetical protein